MESRFRTQYDGIRVNDAEHFEGKSPVVSGQALTGAELFRRQSAGLPVGCAVRQFNQINPYLERFSIFDAIGSFRLRHGMVDSSELANDSEGANPQEVTKTPPETDENQ